ncbi:MAG: hypothetical protein ACI8WL_001072 [Polaribacter sp.]|jgi:uncharacterized protein (TIGR03545 family)|tara:strand:- start:1564 stop:3207 length:1644 start_codon:yes stop_codon:yes gene_type:complete
MMNWIRSWGIALFAVLTLIWVLSIDWLVKSAIIAYGTELNGAQVELESAELSLWPAGLELINLQVTDAYNPMFNRFEAGSISATLDSALLLRRQVIVEQLDIIGVRMNSPRIRSGATKDTPIVTNTGFDFGGLIPDVSLPDMSLLLADAQQQVNAEIAGIEQEIVDIEQRWRNNIEQLPSKDKLAEYRARWDKLSNASFMEKMLGAKKLKNDVSGDLKLIESFNQQLKDDRRLISGQIDRAKGLPRAQADRTMQSVGLSNENVAFVRAITGDQIDQWVTRAKTFSESLSSNTVEQAPSRGTGRWVTFAEDDPLPQVLIRRGQFNGVLQLAASNMRVDGKLSDIAYPLEGYSQPAALVITARDDENASLLFEVTIDHRQADFSDDFNLEVMNLPISELALSSGAEKTLLLEAGNLNFIASGRASPDTVLANVVAKLSDPRLTTDADLATKSEQFLAETLNTLDSVDLQVNVSGALQNPDVNIASNLDKILAAGLKSQISAQTTKFKRQFTDQLGEQTSGQLGALSAKGDFLKDIQALLNDRKAAMPSF